MNYHDPSLSLRTAEQSVFGKKGLTKAQLKESMSNRNSNKRQSNSNFSSLTGENRNASSFLPRINPAR